MAYINLKSIKPKELPTNGEKIIALLYTRWIDTNVETKTIIDIDQFISIAYGEPKDDGSGAYVFTYEWDDGCPFDSEIPHCGHTKSVSDETDWYEIGDKVELFVEDIIVDYMPVTISASISFMGMDLIKE